MAPKAPPRRKRPAAKAKKPIIKRAKTGKRGPPTYKPTDEQRRLVENMVAAGLTRAMTADLLEIDPNTLRRHFAGELKKGDGKANFNVAQGLYLNATTPTQHHPGGHPVSQIFWLKARAGWKEPEHHVHTGADGKPIQHEHHAARDILMRRVLGVAARKKAAQRARAPD